MDPITIEAIALIKRYELETEAAQQSIADKLPRRESAATRGLSAITTLLAALGLTTRAF